MTKFINLFLKSARALIQWMRLMSVTRAVMLWGMAFYMIPFDASASLSVEHLTFRATQACPAFLSKNKQSNPAHLRTELNKEYVVREINRLSPNWFRIDFGDGYGLRWVSKDCGVVQQNGFSDDSCSSIGNADSYVLALSSQSGFCETYGYEAGKPECLHLAKNSYQATHLTLHGLWPNKHSCGLHYGYCGVSPQNNHCDYGPLALSSKVAEQLKQLMPSFVYGSCLERHEWNKHGSCQSLSVNDYFSLAMHLTQQMDASAFGQYLSAHRGQRVAHSVLRKELDKVFGHSQAGKIYLGCKNGILVDIFVQLPAFISEESSLASLVNKAPDSQYIDACPDKIRISSFSKTMWF